VTPHVSRSRPTDGLWAETVTGGLKDGEHEHKLRGGDQNAESQKTSRDKILPATIGRYNCCENRRASCPAENGTSLVLWTSYGLISVQTAPRAKLSARASCGGIRVGSVTMRCSGRRDSPELSRRVIGALLQHISFAVRG
jgi:hypothetical protein